MTSEAEICDRYTLPLEVVIRTTREEDLEGLEWFGLFTPHRELIREAYRRQERREVVMLLAEVNGFPAGQVWVDFVRDAALSMGYVWAVRVLPVFRRKGIGTRLLAAAETAILARGLGAAVIGVEKDNPGARGLYERLGYEVAYQAYEEYDYTTPEGTRIRVLLDQWIMRKSLRTTAREAEAP
jgi:ribosomal protein S18 acetylase RimI-like enzyme